MTHPPLQIALLRGCYLLLAFGLGAQTVPDLLGPAQFFAPMESVVTAMLTTLCLLSIYGLWRPLKMLPLLVFEVAWKAVWVVSAALPRWIDGQMTSEFTEIAFACAFAIPICFVLPWRKWHAS